MAMRAHPPHNVVFNPLHFKNNSFVSERDMATLKTYCFHYCFGNYPLRKNGFADRTNIVNLDITDRVLRATPAEPTTT